MRRSIIPWAVLIASIGLNVLLLTESPLRQERSARSDDPGSGHSTSGRPLTQVHEPRSIERSAPTPPTNPVVTLAGSQEGVLDSIRGLREQSDEIRSRTADWMREFWGVALSESERAELRDALLAELVRTESGEDADMLARLIGREWRSHEQYARWTSALLDSMGRHGELVDAALLRTTTPPPRSGINPETWEKIVSAKLEGGGAPSSTIAMLKVLRAESAPLSSTLAQSLTHVAENNQDANARDEALEVLLHRSRLGDEPGIFHLWEALDSSARQAEVAKLIARRSSSPRPGRRAGARTQFEAIYRTTRLPSSRKELLRASFDRLGLWNGRARDVAFLRDLARVEPDPELQAGIESIARAIQEGESAREVRKRTLALTSPRTRE